MASPSAKCEGSAVLSVYIAAPFQMQATAQAMSDMLDEVGIACTSRWLKAVDCPSDAAARECLEDIDRCDVVVAINLATWADRGTGGRHFELGYAFARQKPILLAGARTNVFHHLEDLLHIDTLDDIPTRVRLLASAHRAKVAAAV